MPLTLVELAQRAYAVYGEAVGGVNVRGEPLPDWTDLGDTVQQGWIAVADQVSHLAYT